MRRDRAARFAQTRHVKLSFSDEGTLIVLVMHSKNSQRDNTISGVLIARSRRRHGTRPPSIRPLIVVNGQGLFEGGLYWQTKMS